MTCFKTFIYVCSIFGCQSIYALKQVEVNFVFSTNNLESKKFDNLKQIQNEIEILNQYFVSKDNSKIFEFKLNQYIPYSSFRERGCKLHDILNQKQPIKVQEVKSNFNTCFARKNKQIYIFIYDAYNQKSDSKDQTSWGFNNGSRPFILLDWQRLNYNNQAALPHEMGHAFGLRHVCVVGAKYQDSTNIMASAGCGLGSGGQRNIGFDPQQLKIILNSFNSMN